MKNDLPISDVIIIGGSYAGMSAAMALGRSLRKVIILDSNMPCNRQTPQAHNFITHDGKAPAEIARIAKEQVLAYPGISYIQGIANQVEKVPEGYRVRTAAGGSYLAKKLLFATGVKDLAPAIPGFAECWGISVLHCPYCHGYEVSGNTIGILAKGDTAYEMCRLLSNWSKILILFTNGPAELSEEQTRVLQEKNIRIVEEEIAALEHRKGYLHKITGAEGNQYPLTALFARIPFEQHCHLPEELGCAITPEGYIQANNFQQTTVVGIYAAGDATVRMRSLANAVAAGNMAGAALNGELIMEEWK